MKYKSYDIARYIMYYCKENNFKYNNTKIQKLLFAVYGVLLAQDEPLIIDESPKMWPYGPVFPTVFNKIKEEDFRPLNMQFDSENTKSIIDTTLSYFAKFSARALSDWSHEKGSPWDKVKSLHGEKWGEDLQDRDIRSYFKEMIS